MTPDEMILFWLQTNLASQFSDAIFRWFSSRIGFSFPILLALLITAIKKEGRQGIGWWFALILVVAIGDQFGNQLKTLFSELRPCANDLTCHSVAKGMPSNHALTFYTASLFVILTRPAWRRWHRLLLTSALLTSLSRIYLAKHFPSQVVAGIFIGIYLGVVAAALYRLRFWLTPLISRIVLLVRLEPWHYQPIQSLNKAGKYREKITRK
jgi:undecaprenyl-diphosphatase